MSTESDPANAPVEPLTLLRVLRDAAPLPWLLTGEQNDDQVEGLEAAPTLPWHVPGNWPHAVIHQFQPGPIMGRGDGYSIADGMQNEADARLVRAAREMAEAISYALTCLYPCDADATPFEMRQAIGMAKERLREAERAVIGPIPTAKPVGG